MTKQVAVLARLSHLAEHGPGDGVRPPQAFSFVADVLISTPILSATLRMRFHAQAAPIIPEELTKPNTNHLAQKIAERVSKSPQRWVHFAAESPGGCRIVGTPSEPKNTARN